MFVVFHRRLKLSDLSEHLMPCAEKRSARPNDEDARRMQWDYWTCVPDLQCHHSAVWKGWRLWWWLVIANFLKDLLHRLLYLCDFYWLWRLLRMLTECSAMHLKIYLEMQKLTMPIYCPICCLNREPENLELRKRLVKVIEHYYGGNVWLWPSSA